MQFTIHSQHTDHHRQDHLTLFIPSGYLSVRSLPPSPVAFIISLASGWWLTQWLARRPARARPLGSGRRSGTSPPSCSDGLVPGFPTREPGSLLSRSAGCSGGMEGWPAQCVLRRRYYSTVQHCTSYTYSPVSPLGNAPRVSQHVGTGVVGGLQARDNNHILQSFLILRRPGSLIVTSDG